MAQTIERADRTVRRNAKTAAADPSTATTEQVVARRAREAKSAKATAVNEADRTSTDIGSPLVAPDGTLRMVPDLGRTVRVVGTVTNVDVNDGPHPKNIRGELGKALNHWYTKMVAKDPLMRATDNSHAADKRNFLTTFTNAASKGAVNERRTEVADPKVMSRHIKRVAKHLGADLVGIAQANPAFMYAAGSRYVQDGTANDAYQKMSPDELAKRFPYVIQATVAWDHETLQAHRHHIGDMSYHSSSMRASMILKSLEGYIKELGYTAIRGAVNPQGAGLAAGLGELGRNGMMITEKFGARVHMPDPILTDLPLVPDKPVDIGVEDFCKICRKCASNCPTNSITFGPKVIYNGIEKYKINWLTCYKIRPFVADHYGSCLTCVAVCPFTKPDAWWRRVGGKLLSGAPVPVRPPIVRALKRIDDTFWGEFPSRRVQFMGYDSGLKPGEHACTIAGCTAEHAETGASIPAAESKIGYYAPVKKNTDSFVRRG
ncbi:MAG: 4Fe-4S dicluster domain-containing protein [Chloroflexota bacterium]|nr:4Fe-4S dicluster domain-containing protein [Chloroflexota bacterium]